MSAAGRETRAPRPGEELDLGKLGPYLERELGLPAAGLTVEQFPGGHSNLTYLVRSGDRELVLRRPPFGSKVATAHDMGREHRVLSRLCTVLPQAPRPVLYCEDEAVMGAKFYLMERLRGVILRKTLPAGVSLEAAAAHTLCERFVDTLIDLHAVDYAAIGLGDLGNPDGYVLRQVTGWTKRYAGSQTDDVPAIDAAAKWLAANLPVSGAPSIVHNDFKFDNLVLAPDDVTRVIGILDWEMTTIGDPLMDLGTALCYWVEDADSDAVKMIAFGPTVLPGMMTRREVADRYAARTGRDLSRMPFYYCFGLFKTAVVVQQIYYRYKQGLTKDERFAVLGAGVKILAEKAIEATQRPGL